MKKWMRTMMAFTAMFSLVALTGCNEPKEDSEPKATPEVEKAAAPAAEHPAESAKPKDNPAH